MHRLFVLTCVLFLVFTFSVNASAVVDNPAKPESALKGKKIGRVVECIEEFRISDIGDKFFLKKPSQIRIAPDGSILVKDHDQTQVFKFDKKGKFLSGLLKMGKGPGELANVAGFFLDGDEFFVNSFMPTKVVGKDVNGKLTGEFLVNTQEYIFYLFGRYDGKYYFYHRPLTLSTGVTFLEYRIITCDKKGEISETGLKFKLKKVMTHVTVKKGDTVRTAIKTADLTNFLHAETRDGIMFTATDERYLIRKTDLKTGKILKEFRRAYTPAAYFPNPDHKFVNSKEYKKLYQRKYYTDVNHVLIAGDQLWAFTSTMDKGKGILVDVFDFDGKLIDQFFLKLPGLDYPDGDMLRRLYYHNGALYIPQPDEDENQTIVKYKIKD